MTEPDKLILIERLARHRAAAADALRRYEAAVARAGGPVETEIHAVLKGEVWEAEAALAAARTSLDRDRLAAVGPDEIQRIRRQAQEDVIAEIARAKGWQWAEGDRRWRTPDGASYSRVGEPL